MDVIQLVVIIMVVTILATLTLAAAAYAAFRIREQRSPKSTLLAPDAPIFFERVRFLSSETPAEA